MSDEKNFKSDGNRFELALAFLKERYPAKTADRVAADTGIPANTIAQWLCGNSSPRWKHTMALIGAYGADFLWAASPDSRVWLGPVRKLEELRRLQLQRVQLDRQIKALDGRENEISRMDSGRSASGGGPVLLARDVVGPSLDLDGDGRLAGETEGD